MYIYYDLDDDESESDELNPEEMKLHLELYEQEMIVLRRKTDELEQENENFQQEIKYLQDKLVSQPITKMEIPEIPAGSPVNVIYDHKIKILETEARELRKKLVDKEKENESLRTEVELHRRRTSKVINRSRSLDSEGQSLDMKKQLQLFEQEANILRQKMIALENENEKLLNENKRLQLRISKKPPPGPADQLQMENIELKDKIRELERKCDSLKTDLMNTKLNTETTETETDFIANLKKQLRQKETDLSNQQSKLAKMDIEMAKINREYKKLKDSLNPRFVYILLFCFFFYNARILSIYMIYMNVYCDNIRYDNYFNEWLTLSLCVCVCLIHTGKEQKKKEHSKSSMRLSTDTHFHQLTNSNDH